LGGGGRGSTAAIAASATTAASAAAAAAAAPAVIVILIVVVVVVLFVFVADVIFFVIIHTLRMRQSLQLPRKVGPELPGVGKWPEFSINLLLFVHTTFRKEFTSITILSRSNIESHQAA
jgi:heme/copper-type cytochrome/quinol oxidase subunit 2